MNKGIADNMPLCKAKLKDGEPCPQIVKRGHKFCRWHDPQHKSWLDLYTRLEKLTPEEKTDVVLELIEDNPEHRLELPERDGQYANLSGIDLSKESLDKRRALVKPQAPPWWHSDRGGANLTYANLKFADLTNANLHGAYLGYADLEEASLENIDLRGADLLHANLSRSNLKGANLEEAELRYADLQYAHLEHANMKHAKLLEATMQYSDLQGADLQGADLMYTQSQNARFNRAKLMGAKLEHAQMEGTYFGGANLSGAFLYGSNLQGAHLEFTNLQRTQLNGANLQECDLTGADLSSANLKEAKLQNIDLNVADSISNVYITGAWLDRTRIRQERLKTAIGEEMDCDFSAAKYGYLALKQNFDDLGDYEASSWAYRRERQMEKLEARENKNYLKFFSDSLVEWLCDYGESAKRVIIWIAVLLFVIGPLLFSGLGGVQWSEDLSQDYFALPSLGKLEFLYIHYFLYTLDVFTTASFSGLEPINNAVKVASGSFAILGIFLAGLLGFVAGNRIRRS